jgi:hypothetical protein
MKALLEAAAPTTAHVSVIATAFPAPKPVSPVYPVIEATAEVPHVPPESPNMYTSFASDPTIAKLADRATDVPKLFLLEIEKVASAVVLQVPAVFLKMCATPEVP